MQVMNFSSANCKNCYKCVRSCPVKAIEVLNDQAKIQETKCVSCGHCLMVCPQNARHVLSDIDDVKAALRSKKNVVAQLAPAFRGVFPNSNKFISALKLLGFSRIEEVSIGAELVTQEYEKLINRSNNNIFLTSCCPSVVMLIEKYFPELFNLILPVVSPMIAHGKTIRKRYPDSFIVFIGPCISKKTEALSDQYEGIIDSVLTFDEIIDFFKTQNIDYEKLPDSFPDLSGTFRGDKYPLVGGILNCINSSLNSKKLNIINVHGLDNCISLLKELENNNLNDICIELSACNESCLGGPGGIHGGGTIYSRLQRIQQFSQSQTKDEKLNSIFDNFPIDLSRKFRNKKVYLPIPKDDDIIKILNKMGKFKKEHELNCGACGYNTCIEKAVAVYHGMSQIEMCVPYMRSLAEGMNAEIFCNSPNAILILDKDLVITDANPVAEKIFNLDNCIKLKGKIVNEIIVDDDFLKVAKGKINIQHSKIYYPEYKFHGYKSVTYVESHNALLVIFTDISEEEKRKLELIQVKHSAIDVTQSIIHKQMLVAQEIASLLGESTAETKVALIDLKKVLEKETEL